MILTIALGVLLAGALALNLIQFLKGRKSQSPLEKSVQLFVEGVYKQDSPKDDPLLKDFNESLINLNLLLESVTLNSQKSERASARLSRNIQKALMYTSGISSHANDNLATSTKLFQLVAEGSAAVEEIHASIRSLKEQVDVQNQEILQTSQAMKSISEALENVSSISSKRMTDTQKLVQLTAVGNTKISETDQVISMVQGKVDDVLTLITVINKIASQTNLLSMNAAIEAAHAGEAGRGFAVVAQEIRNLAESTGKNAKSISETLKNLVEHIQSAAQLSKESGSAFSQIETGVTQVADGLNQINQQTIGVAENAQEVVKSAAALQDISQQTTTSMKEMEIGAGDINNILENSKAISDDLDGSMQDMTQKTRSINLITTKISSSYLQSNKVFAEILSGFNRYSNSVQQSGEINVENRMLYSNLILAHINWVATARALIDGSLKESEVNLIDATQCQLGKWMLKGETRQDLGDDKYNTLDQMHHELHATVEKIIQALRSKEMEIAEEKYLELTEQSKQIVQILTTIGYNDFIQWSPELSIEVEDFDKHHAVLIGLINKLYVSMEEGKGASVLSEVFQELIDYTDFHFAEEEKVMAHYEYPGLDEQLKQHKALLDKARSLQTDFRDGKAVLSNELLDFLQDWVMNHILKVDKKYAQFFEGKEVHSMVQEYHRS